MKFLVCIPLIFTSSCSLIPDRLSVCEAIDAPENLAKRNIVISGVFRTDGMHTSTISDSKCPGQSLAPFVRRNKQSDEIDAIGADKMLERVFDDAIDRTLASYHIVARGSLGPVPTRGTERSFEIVEVIEFESIGK